MAAQDVAAAYYRRQQRITRHAAAEAQRLWRQVDRADLSGSWGALTPQVLQVLVAAQLLAASGAQEYVTDSVTVEGGTPDPAGRVVPGALAGVASDGRDLLGLLAWPMIETKTRIALGQPLGEAVGGGLASLLRIVSTQVQDAGRVATGVGITADRAVIGYVRVLSPPSCSRCAALAGRLYRWNAGFQRHPHCDCVHQPTTRREWDRHQTDVTDSPERYFRSLSRSEQDRIFTRAGAQAIRDGADVAQVVNARRGAAGLSSAGGRLTREELRAIREGLERGRLVSTRLFGQNLFVTTEGTTSRGLAGVRLGARDTGVKLGGARYRSARAPRLMPESIYQIAAGDREEAIRLLRRYGFIL